VIRRVVVGVDQSPSSAEAVRWAADLADLVGARVTVVHAADLVERYKARAPSEEAFEDELRATVDRDWCAPLRHHGVVFDVVVRPANAADLLLEVSAEGADLIVVGRRRSGGPDFGKLGSTSQRLASEAAVPVVVLPPAP
jgi:nucleotide-binding universal stress UspA family protein